MARTARRTAPGRRIGERGVTYLALLIVVAAIGAALASTGTLWHDVQQREKERELLFVGMEYRDAIRQYYESSPGGAKKYPPSIEALLLDERVPSIRRHLRRPYRDPLTHSDQWGVLTSPQGGIMGVYSLAPGQPIKQANFPDELKWPGDTGSYADWQFMYLPEEGK